MTLVVSWIGKDSHGYTSAYIASDSRVSWGRSSNYDSCRKTYFSKRFPDIVGYCGDVLFPTLVLQSIFELIDLGLLINDNATCSERFDAIRRKLTEEISHYPQDNNIAGSFEMIYVAHEIEEGYPKFKAYTLKWEKGKKIKTKELPLPDGSGLLYSMGSGKECFKQNYDKYMGNKTQTTRFIFHSFLISLMHMTDPLCGGAPQLVGIYRKPGKGAFSYGIIYNKVRYYNGMRIDDCKGINKIAWRNRFFEICNGKTKKRKPNAARQGY